MLKKIILTALTFFSILALHAQNAKQLATLQNLAKQHRIVEDAEFAKAVEVAKQKGWPITQKFANGNIAVLQRIDALGNPEYLTTYNNTIAAATTRANQLWPGGSSGLNLNGSSSAVTGKLGVWDGGLILRTHVEFAGGRIMQKDSSRTDITLSNHATHTSGTMIAAGVNPIAKGMAYGLQKLIAYYGLSNDVSTISIEAPNMLISNHSYGQSEGWVYTGNSPAYSWYGDTTISYESYIFGYYGSRAQLYDSILYNAPNYMMVMSAGNANGNSSGNQGPAVGATYAYNGSAVRTRTAGFSSNPTYGSVGGGQVAKNMITVGAVSGIPSGYNSPSDVKIADFSCWGPTDDGRIKPDIVADGVNVVSTISTSNTAYEAESGTSMSSPNAAGSLLLVQEYYNQKHPGLFMKGATLKALAIHTADEAGTTNGPDYKFGYGLLNVLKATSVITSSYNQKTDTIIEKTLTSGTPYTISVVASGSGPLKATIVWSDPTGTVDNTNVLNNPTPKLVHDLDLRIAQGSSTYYPWILNPNNPTAAATKGDDNLNTVEQVLVDSTIPGKTYTITVSNKGALVRGTQPFSLIISGIGGTAYATSSATSSAGTRIDSVNFAGIANKTTTGCTTYRDYTNIAGSVQANQTIPLTIQLSSCDGSTASKIVKVYIDYNNNGSFTDAGDLVATSGTLGGGSQTYTTSISTPAGLTIGNTLLMRIVTVETTDASTINPTGTYTNGETEDYRLLVSNPSNDLTVNSIIAPTNGSTFNANQYLAVSIRNVGSVDKTNIPLTAIIKNGSTTVATLTGNFPGTVTAGNSINYTFQTPFTLSAATTYTITVIQSISGDQNHTNDTLTQTITTGAKGAAPNAIAEICTSPSVFYKVNNPVTSRNYFWYDAANANTPIATGTTGAVNTTANPIYVSSGARVTVGPANNTVFGTGGYNSFVGNYIYVTAGVPVILETAKIYATTAGKLGIGIHPATKNSSGGYSYYISPSDTVTLDVYPNLDASSNDTGAYHYLNLHFDNSYSGTTGYLVYFNCLNGTSIYRNNAVPAPTPYPIGPANIFQVANTLVTNPDNYYYFLYNMKLVTYDSLSDRIAVTPTTAPTPVITQTGNVLSSNITSGTLQWFNASGSISGATSASYTATASGSYYVVVTDALGCQKTSNTITVTITAVINANNSEIGLTVSPNPASSQINVNFTTNTKADVNVQLLNAVGTSSISNTYSNFVGKFNQQYNVSNLAAGIYVLKVQQGNKVYRQKVLITK
ncbi:MAG: S8 family peptidase [Bacteroidetes bacterium]|nr:S8 family peptidase [Bacteroidota bacterium]MBS1648560.1 S8 family peptidase [Bacteroidota bacterium]